MTNSDSYEATWARSVPTVKMVLEVVAHHYRLRPSNGVLIRSFNNDVYKVDASGASFALKVYGVGRWTADEIRWEQHLVRHLHAAGLAVPQCVPLLNDDTVGSIVAPEGVRFFALSEWLGGEKPSPPWTDDLYKSLGASLARLHETADGLETPFERKSVRTGLEIREVILALKGHPERQELVRKSGIEAEGVVGRLGCKGLRWGVRHGDPSLDNVHISHGTVYLYDFDLAAPGWQVEDLTGALSTPQADHFLSGYTSVRLIHPVEFEAMPWLRVLGIIENLHFHLIGKPAALGTSTLAEGWVDRGFESLVSLVDELGL